MTQILHDIEKRIITSLRDNSPQTSHNLEISTGLSADQIRRGMEWLKLKGFANIAESQSVHYILGKNGLGSLENGLPERRLLDSLANGPQKPKSLQKVLGDAFGPAVGMARKNGWIDTSDGVVSLNHIPTQLPGEKSIKIIGKSSISEGGIPSDDLQHLLRRPDFVVQKVVKTRDISLTEKAISLELSGNDSAIDVEAQAPRIHIARNHPLKDVINEIRETFVTLGFSEILGTMSQSSFWNFDALFTPQDHPAREMQDTFYLDGVRAENFASKKQISNVERSHRNGWHYTWNAAESARMVLRTHTTCVTIKYLAENKPDEARIFSLGRVFRNEKVSYKHLVEFNQVEGVLVGSGATLRNLMGIQKEFYKRMGLYKVKFWPTFFPYTEPSLQTMVYNDRLGKWVELFGMGIFRPEVTKPLGITKPVLAWGGGIERIAMLKYGIDDVRDFYANDMEWLRSASRCR